MKLLWMAASLALVATGTAYAKDDDQGKSSEEKKICKTEKVTGSRTRVKRICMTQAEWDELAARTQEGIDKYRNGASGRVPADQNPLGGG